MNYLERIDKKIWEDPESIYAGRGRLVCRKNYFLAAWVFAPTMEKLF